MKTRICIVTAGHLSTCPRMVKAADALSAAGYDVHVISTRFLTWATHADADIRRSRVNAWKWTVVSYDRASFRNRYVTALRARGARLLASALGPTHIPLWMSARAFVRPHTELLRAAVRTAPHLFYGGGGALAVAAAAGRVTRTPYALDLEDFHSAESEPDKDGRIRDALAGHIECHTLSGARFLTAAGEAIATAYANKYGTCPLAINNTFPLPSDEPALHRSSGSRLKLYWFSQTIGQKRGLEDVIQAMGEAGLGGELHLRGRPVCGYVDDLHRLQSNLAPRLELIHHDPGFPDDMVDLCRGYDVGLSPEQAQVVNKTVCLGNKPLTYILAGVPVVLTDTPGHLPLARDLGAGAVVYRAGDVSGLARALTRWATDPNLLLEAKRAAWRAAKERWHWEHELERGALLRVVERAVL